MIINTVIVAGLYLAFGWSAPTETGWIKPVASGWYYLAAYAVLADAFNVLTKPLRINIPVIGLADIRKVSDSFGDVTTRKDGKPFANVDPKDVGGGYL